AGSSSVPYSRARPHGLASEWRWWPPPSTSQDWSSCGARVQKSLSVRPQVCPGCGLVLDRDEHAAKHVLRAGQARGASRGDGARGELRIFGIYPGECQETLSPLRESASRFNFATQTPV